VARRESSKAAPHTEAIARARWTREELPSVAGAIPALPQSAAAQAADVVQEVNQSGNRCKPGETPAPPSPRTACLETPVFSGVLGEPT